MGIYASGAMLAPSSMQVVEFELDSAALMSRIAEDEAGITAKDACLFDRLHRTYAGVEDDGRSTHTGLNAYVHLGYAQSPLPKHRER